MSWNVSGCIEYLLRLELAEASPQRQVKRKRKDESEEVDERIIYGIGKLRGVGKQTRDCIEVSMIRKNTQGWPEKKF